MKPALPSGWAWARLGTVLIRRRDLINPSDFPAREFTSIGLEDIGSGGTGEVSTRLVAGEELASSKAQFEQGDLLYGRLRPYLNKVAVAPSQGVGSTEIWVLGPTPIIDREFAFWMLTSRYMLKQMERVTEGANLPRVDADGFDRVEIPVPPLSEQRRIVEILNEARDIRRLRQQADDLTSKLVPAIFNEMFGDPIGEAPSSQRSPVSAFVAEMAGGKSLGEDPSGTRYRVVKVSAVTWGMFQPDESKYVDDNYTPPADHLVRKGDLLFSRANTEELVGATVLVEDDYPDVLLSDKIWRFVWKHPEQVDPFYMLALFQHPSVRREISNNATGTGGSMKNISKAKLMSIRVIIAPYEMQRRFGETVRQISSLHLDERDYRTMMNSLLAYAFSGELTADWRTQNLEQLAQEATERDQWLRDNGGKLTNTNQRIEDRLDDTPERLAELNREQLNLLEHIRKLEPKESGGTFTISSLVSNLEEPLEQLPVDAIRRHLDVLATCGFIKAISRQSGDGVSASIAFGNVYREPRRESPAISASDDPDFLKLSELDRLLRQATEQYEIDQLRAGNLAPRSGTYQEIGQSGELGKSVVMEAGKSLPPPTLVGGIYQWKGGD